LKTIRVIETTDKESYEKALTKVVNNGGKILDINFIKQVNRNAYLEIDCINIIYVAVIEELIEGELI